MRFTHESAWLLVTVAHLIGACSSAKIMPLPTEETLPTQTVAISTLKPPPPTNAPYPVATPMATLTQTSYPTPEATRRPATVVVTSGPTLELSNQFEISIKDNGRTFTYTVTSRFMVFLDGTAYPENEYTCIPEGIISWVSNASGLYNPELDLISVGFEGVQPGICVLTNGDFSITIQMVDWRR